MKYAVQKEDGTLLEVCGKKVGFNSKDEAEAWIRKRPALWGKIRQLAR